MTRAVKRRMDQETIFMIAQGILEDSVDFIICSCLQAVVV